MVDVATLAFNIDSSDAKTAGRDLDKLGGAAKRAEGDVRKATQSLEQRMRGAARSVGRATAAIGAAVSAVGTGIVLAVRGQINAFDELAKTSERIGVPVEALSQLEHAANLSGASMSSLQYGLRRLSQEMAQDSERFTELGIAVRDIEGNMRATEDVLLDFADVLNAMPEGAERTALALEVLGRGGLDLVPMLNQGSDAIRRMMDEADQLGLTVTQEMAQAAEAFNDNITRIQGASRGFWRAITGELAPALEALSDKAVELVNRFGGMSPEMRRFIAIAGAAVVALGPLLLVISSIAFALAAISAPVLIAIGAFTALAVAAAWVASSWDDLKDRYPILERLEDIGRRLKEVWDDLPPLKWALLIPVLRWAAFIPGLRWAAFIPKLTWSVLITALSWARFIPKIGWAILAGQLAWSLLISRVNWRDWIPQINWRDFIPEINWENLFGGARGAARQVGQDVADGLADGIESGTRRRGRPAAESLADQVIRGAQERLETQSPSRVFMRMGVDVAEGLAIGIEDNSPRAIGAMENLAAELQRPIQTLGDQLNQSFARAFESVLAGTQNLRGAFRSMVQDIRGMFARNITQSIFGGGGAGGGGMFGGGGMLGGLGGIGGAFMSGAMGSIGAFSGGIGAGFSAIGAQVGSISFAGGFTAGLTSVAGALGAVLGPLAIVGGLIRGIIGSTRTIDQGLRVTADETGTLVETFRERERRMLFGLIRSRSTRFTEADAEVADPIVAAVAETQASIMNMADALGIASDAFEGFQHVIEFSTADLSEDQIAQRLQEEFGKLADAFADMALAETGLVREGEGAAEAMTSLYLSINTVNSALQFLNRELLEVSLNGAAAARDLVELMGGLEQFQEAQRFFFDNFYSDAEQLQLLSAELGRAFEELGETVPGSIEAYRALIEAQDLNTESGRQLYASLMGLAPAFVDVVQRSEQLNSALGATGSAITGLSQAAQAEVRRLQQQLFQLQGNIAAVRAMQLEDLQSDEARALQREIFALQDARDRERATTTRAASASRSASRATEQLNDATRERERLERRILELQGDTASLRAIELANLDESNRHLQERIWNLEDEQAIMREREGLETRLLRLQGNTAELRRRELEALDASNRGLQLAIWRLEDFNDAMRRLSENDFATLVDFQRAVALEANRALGPASATSFADAMITAANDNFAPLSERVSDQLDGLSEAITSLTVAIEHMGSGGSGGLLEMLMGGARIRGRRITFPRVNTASLAPMSSSSATADNALRGEVIELKEYVRELVKLNIKQERSLREIQIQSESA